MTASNHPLPIAVIGAGPVGLAAAAHLIQRGLNPLVLEAGASVGANLESYRHVQLFSPWRFNIDRAAQALLAAHGWQAPDAEQLPTAGALVDHYLRPLSEHPTLAPQLRLGHRVLRISRAGIDKVKTAGRERAAFLLQVQTASGRQELRAQAIIDASGTWTQPNPLGASGMPALGEPELADQIVYGMPDVLGAERARYAGRRVLVVGAGHSAVGNLIALAELADSKPQTQVVWALRGDTLALVFGGGDADQLPARGALGKRLKALIDAGRLEVRTGFRVQALHRADAGISVQSETQDGRRASIEGIDEIIVATGARPNLEITRELRLRLDPWLESTELLAPLIDPNQHSCGTLRPHGHRELAHPEAGYYAVGARSYGRAPNFLMATGYEQVRSVVAALAGDLAAADDVQLELPETGVCSVRLGTSGLAEQPAAAKNCCGGPAAADSGACCARDAAAKAGGADGCGCASRSAPAKRPEAACCG